MVPRVRRGGVVRGYRCSERRPAVALAALRHVRCVRGHACLLCARVRTSPLLPGPSPRWLKFSCPLPAPPACTSHRREGLPLSSLSLCRSPSQGCFDCELIAGWGTRKRKSKPRDFKRTGAPALSCCGWVGGFPCFFKGDTKDFPLSLKSSQAKLWQSRGRDIGFQNSYYT